MISHQRSGRTLARSIEWMGTPRKRAIGMLKFSEAPENFAAIFKLPFGGFLPLIHTFGMHFTIDILFCDSQKKVVHKAYGVKPGKLIFPFANAFGGCSYILEFSKCDLSDVQCGDHLAWEGGA
jgi:uncharacterized membrane protein (UPF0127 family)